MSSDSTPTDTLPPVSDEVLEENPDKEKDDDVKFEDLIVPCIFCGRPVNELSLTAGVVKNFHLNCWIRTGIVAIQKARENGVAPENVKKLEEFEEAHRVAAEMVKMIEISNVFI